MLDYYFTRLPWTPPLNFTKNAIYLRLMRRNGFSLVELLIVVALIGLLLGIILPAMAAAKDRGRSLVCQSNLKKAITATLTFAAQNKDRLPQGFNDYGFASLQPPGGYLGRPTVDWQGWWWINYIADESNLPRNNPSNFAQANSAISEKRYLAEFKCPSSKDIENSTLCGHYGANYAVLKLANPHFETEYRGLSPKTTSLRQPSRLFLLTDSGYALISRKAFLPTEQVTFENKKRTEFFYLPGLASNASRRIHPELHSDAVKGRHWNRRVNAAFADGRVAPTPAEELAENAQ